MYIGNAEISLCFPRLPSFSPRDFRDRFRDMQAQVFKSNDRFGLATSTASVCVAGEHADTGHSHGPARLVELPACLLPASRISVLEMI